MRFPTPRRIPSSLAALASVALLLFASCDEPDQVTGRSDETHTSVVDIQGRVLTKDARPYGNVIVQLRGLGLLDTTDGEGQFRFRIDSLPTSDASGKAVDTVDYLRDGQTILSVPVPTWVATLPDVMLVQRDLSGTLLGDLSDVGSVVCELDLPDGSSQRIELELNATTRRYSGFAYFRYSGGVDTFTARVQVLDHDGGIMGTGKSLSFTSRAGDISFPDLGATNALPRWRLRGESHLQSLLPSPYISAGVDTFGWSETPGVSRREKLVIHANLTDSQLVAARVEWFLGGAWVRASGPSNMPMTPCPVCYYLPMPDPVLPSVSLHFDTTVSVPTDAAGWWFLRVRVVDTLERTFEDTLRVRVVPAAPGAGLDVGLPGSTVPGARLHLGLSDSETFHGRIVSRRIYVGRTPYRSTGPTGPIDPWTGTVQKAWVAPPLLESSLPSTDDSLDLAETRQFRRGTPSVEVSGKDTVYDLPRELMGEFGILYEVVDEDGDTGIARVVTVVRPPAPRIDSLVAGPDSVVVRWSYGLWPSSPRGGLWIATGGWQGVPDTFRLEISGEDFRVALPRPWGARNLRLRLQRSYLAEGDPTDTLLESLPSPVLTFHGAAMDSTRLLGVGNGFGESGFGRLTGGAGVALAGEVARLEWSMGNSESYSGAYVWIPLGIEPGARHLHLDVANRSSMDFWLPVRATSNFDYDFLATSVGGLGWTIPAGFVGSLDLDVDSLRWPEWATASDTLGIDREEVIAGIDAIQFEVRQYRDPTVRSGVLELDNLGWR